MNILQASSAVVKSATRYAWWGVALGVFVGLHVAGSLAKPLAGEVSKGAAAFGKGLSSLRERLKKAAEENGGGKQTARKDEKPVKIQVEDVVPSAEAASTESQEEPPAEMKAGAGAVDSPAGARPSLQWSKAALVEEAKRLGVATRQSMTKKELLEAINARK
jgi:hypothetical protein